MNFRMLSMLTLVLIYSKLGGFSGIGNRKMSLSLFAAFASSEPQNAFFIADLP